MLSRRFKATLVLVASVITSEVPANPCLSATIGTNGDSHTVTYRYDDSDELVDMQFIPTVTDCAMIIRCTSPDLPSLCGDGSGVTVVESKLFIPIYTYGNACNSKSDGECGPVNCPSVNNCRWAYLITHDDGTG